MFSQFLKFAVVGVANSAIHYGVFLITYRFMDMHYLAASALGYCLGLLNSFICNKQWTFRTAGTDTKVEFTRFLVVNLLSLGINLAAMELFVSFLSASPEAAQLLAIACSFCANFLGNKFWTFKRLE